MTRSEFESALKGALRHYTQTDLLAGNALLQARVLSRSGPDGNTPQKLRALLGKTADSLFANERDRKLYRVLDLTYFNPAPKQEAAAARLGLSLSTYRRYLTSGIDRLTEWLWRQEQESARSEATADHSTERTFADAAAHQNGNVAEPRDAFQRGVALLSKLSTAPPLPDKPSIAVMPFTNMSGDPDQGYFADGMAEEIITALSRIRWLFVIARNSSFTYKGQAIDVKRVGRELGVRYVLEGSVRKAGSRVRITAQLIEAETGAHLWADRFDGSLEAVFDLQDKVATSVAGVIEPTLQAAEIRRSTARPASPSLLRVRRLATATEISVAQRLEARPSHLQENSENRSLCRVRQTTSLQICRLQSVFPGIANPSCEENSSALPTLLHLRRLDSTI